MKNNLGLLNWNSEIQNGVGGWGGVRWPKTIQSIYKITSPKKLDPLEKKMRKGLLNNVIYTELFFMKIESRFLLLLRFENLNFVIALLFDILKYLNNEKHC